MTTPDLIAPPRRFRRAWTIPALVAVAAGIFAFLDAPYANVTPGPTPELSELVLAKNVNGDIDPTFGSAGAWHATTINATPLSWWQLAQCNLQDDCDVFPLATGSGTKERAREQMSESIANASEMAATWVGGPGDHDITMNADLGEVGGPSAGLMLTLAFIDAATDGDLTGGRVIAGTGTMNSLAEVGPISGIAFKVDGAVAAGATVFFAPHLEADDALAAAKGKNIEVVSVSHLPDAIAWLCQHGGASPVCTSPALQQAMDEQAATDALTGH